MKTVQTIRSRKKIDDIKTFLLEDNIRDYLLFVLGINTALRVGDILKLTRGEVMNGDKIRDILRVRISKTGKEKRIALNMNVKKAIKIFLRMNPELKDYSPLFSGNRGLVPMSRVNAWKRLQRLAKKFDLIDFGFHSLRKTWGYQARKSGVDISIISEKLGHSSVAVTRRYLGITDDEVNSIELAICL